MKHFRIISTAFIIAISAIFACNVFYLAGLYRSIRDTVEKDVMTSLADADIEELWIRAKDSMAQSMQVVPDGQPQHGEISVGQASDAQMVSTTRHPDGNVTVREAVIDSASGITNRLVDEVGKQFHAVMDPLAEVNLSVMDSVIARRLNNRYIFPARVYTDVIDHSGNVLKSDPQYTDGSYDVFHYCFNPAAGHSYRVSITPLTRHILSEMAGVIITVFLLMLTFALAFAYLFRTVSRLRTIEEMKDDFVNNMTHELKTPIAIAYSANDSLLNYGADSDPAKRDTYLRIANRQLQRLGELVENILAMSMERRNTLRLDIDTIHLRPLLHDIATAQRMRADKKIDISISGTGDITVRADRTHLSNVINNLIDNAIKYSTESVTITIRYDSEGFSVADNGIGIPAASLPYVFHKFYRVPHGDRLEVRGYGIGLYYVKSILDKMGWTISVSSRKDEGSIFTVKYHSDEPQNTAR